MKIRVQKGVVLWAVVVRLEAQTASFYSGVECFTADTPARRWKMRHLDWGTLVS